MTISTSLSSSWISSTALPALVCVIVTFCCCCCCCCVVEEEDLVGRRVLFFRCCLLLPLTAGAFFTCKCNTRFFGNRSRPNFCSDRWFDLSSRPKKKSLWCSDATGPNKSALPKSSFNSPSLVESGRTTYSSMQIFVVKRQIEIFLNTFQWYPTNLPPTFWHQTSEWSSA